MLRSTHYVVDDTGRRTAVLVDIADWERLLTWLEVVGDTQTALTALDELAAADGDPARAGWVDWQSARGDWIEDDTAGD